MSGIAKAPVSHEVEPHDSETGLGLHVGRPWPFDSSRASRRPYRASGLVLGSKAGILEIDGVEVGFASFGDIERDLGEDLKLLIEHGCAVIVCATHPASMRLKGSSLFQMGEFASTSPAMR